jgi:hypothetical protein
MGPWKAGVPIGIPPRVGALGSIPAPMGGIRPMGKGGGTGFNCSMAFTC